MSLDIRTAIITASLILLLFAIISGWRGFAAVRSARRLPFFRMRRLQTMRGWRLFFLAIVLILLVVFLNVQGEPLIYQYFPPTATFTLTPTITITPTITLTPTITVSPTITLTPSVTDTPTITATPAIPLAIVNSFESTITPNPDAVFSPLTFTNGLDEQYRPLNPGTVFQNPVGHMYAIFSYDGMNAGSQWSALWYRGGELVHYETKPWDGGSGGLGYTDWNPSPDQWLIGMYEVQIFIGELWKIGGAFLVEGEPPTPLPTDTPTPTLTPTKTVTPTKTSYPTATPRPTNTPRPTPTPSRTPTPTRTRAPFYTPTVTLTRTPWPTATRVTPLPTITPQPTRTRTPTPVPF